MADGAAGLRVLDVAERRRDVARSPRAAARVERPAAVADRIVGRAGRLRGRRAQLELGGAGGPGRRRRRNDLADHVDQTADRVGAVEQRRRPAHDFDPGRRQRVDRHAMVGRLARQVVGALAVLQDQDAIAVEPADDGPRRRRTERALRDAGLGLEQLAQGGLGLDREVLARQHGGRLVGLERIARLDADRDDLGVVELGLERDVEGGAGLDRLHLETVRRERFGADPDMDYARTNPVDAVGPVRAADRRLPGFLDRHDRPADRRGGMAGGDTAGDGVRLNRGRRGLPGDSRAGGRGDREDEEREPRAEGGGTHPSE